MERGRKKKTSKEETTVRGPRSAYIDTPPHRKQARHPVELDGRIAKPDAAGLVGLTAAGAGVAGSSSGGGEHGGFILA
jgi:hypothetical protein